MRKATGMLMVCAVLVFGMLAPAQAEIAGAAVYAVQYNGGDGLFVALVSVPTTDKTLDVTLSLPGPDAKGQTVLHAIQEWHLSGYQLFKFATKGKPVVAAGDVIEVLIVDPESEDAGDATATCRPVGLRYFVCR